MTELRITVCGCGCGALMKPGQKFVRGHSRRTTIADRITIQETGFGSPCWLWPTLDHNGYPTGRYFDGRRVKAHRAVYTQLIGPIPEGMQLDHLCRVPACVNPAHLEPVTPKENTHRSNATKLTDKQVAEIIAERDRFYAISPLNNKGRLRRRVPNRMAVVVAERYGVAPGTVRKLWQRRGRRRQALGL